MFSFWIFIVKENFIDVQFLPILILIKLVFESLVKHSVTTTGLVIFFAQGISNVLVCLNNYVKSSESVFKYLNT